MTRWLLLMLLACLPAQVARPVSGGPPVGPDALDVALSFLPPNAALAQDYDYDFSAGRVSRRWPAVLTGHIVSESSRDIVYAYYTPARARGVNKTLFLGLLHHTPRGYTLVYTLSYRDRFIFSPHGLRILDLAGIPTGVVVIVTAMGAALGGTMRAYVWRDAQGWQNIFPANGSISYFYFFRRPAGLYVALSSFNRPGLNVSPPPVWYKWSEKRFLRTPAPAGALRWKPLK